MTCGAAFFSWRYKSTKRLMRTSIQACWIIILVLSWGLSCLAQSNADSTVPSGSGPLTGNRVAAVNYLPIWQIGSPPFSLRILGGDYWTDSTGRIIPWAANTPRQRGDKHHQFTRLLLGRVSLSMPLSPTVAAFVCITVALLLGFLALGCVNRRAEAEQKEQAKT